MAPYTFAVGDRIRLKGNISDTIGHIISLLGYYSGYPRGLLLV